MYLLGSLRRRTVRKNEEAAGMKNWRIYRLPGSRKIWHIDSGCGTALVNVAGFICHTSSKSVDLPEANRQPRAWIEIPIDGVDFHIIDGVAIFEFSGIHEKAGEFVKAAMECSKEQENGTDSQPEME